MGIALFYPYGKSTLKNMIPPLIHYCWFGGNPLPEKAQKCITSWKKYFPGHEIREINETNYDVHKIPYTSETYGAKKYAFVSDYARFDTLYQYGGIYFDTDVEVIKSFDNIISAGPFLGMETAGRINPGLGCALSAGMPIVREILDQYGSLRYIQPDGSENNATIVDFATGIFSRHGFENKNVIQEITGVKVYPVEYFNPIDYDTHYLCITENTYSIHYGSATWVNKPQKISAAVHIWLCRIFGKKTGRFFSKIFRTVAKFMYELIAKTKK
jgi:mannosyltransferase OCH1-like enzyme